jgi:hypothetical protein
MAIQDRRAALRFQWQPRRMRASIRCAAALTWAPRSSGRHLGRAAPRPPPPHSHHGVGRSPTCIRRTLTNYQPVVNSAAIPPIPCSLLVRSNHQITGRRRDKIADERRFEVRCFHVFSRSSPSWPNDKANRAAAKSLETRKTAQPAVPVERLVGAVLTGNDPQPSPK